MQLYMTRNLRKDLDFVNGMRCEVESWDEVTRAIWVKTATGKRVAITPWSDEDHGGLVYYAVRPGYASTIMKFQGAELEHVTVYLDAKHVPAAAYTAMSRVRLASQCLIGGWVTPDHFTPAR
jgi:ATP-dependent exoDNAse (exonuclease V) alpha subunit